jgi:dTDP-4-amino-4,6-dideoxygalactose transaminase
MTDSAIPYIDLVKQQDSIKDELMAAVEGVLHHGQFILGPEVSEFERRFADFCGVRYAVGVDNGTSALFLIMACLGIAAGDEVITSPHSFVATASSIALTGARPVFVDVRDDYNMDPYLIEDAITARTKAILPVHLTGRPADMHAILKTAEKHHLVVIEDCAQAVGAAYHDQKVGSFGIAGGFSLHPLKNLNALGDAGVITTNNGKLYKRLLKARNHGLRNRDECEFWGHNCRLDTIQAAILLVKMKYLDQWTESRRSTAAYYRDILKDLFHVPMERSHEYSVYHTFVVRCEERDFLQRHLANQGIETKVHYPIPICFQDAALSCQWREEDFPVTSRLSRQILSLPIYPELTAEQKAFIVESILGFYSR